jgi:radical SAM superfamily enzyme
VVIHRLTGDGDKRTLLAPLWSGEKKQVLNAVRAAFLRDDVEQGSACGSPEENPEQIKKMEERI